MKLLMGALVAFLVGAGCRFFDIPAPCPAVLPGAALVLDMTFGYTTVDRARTGKAQSATTKILCGGPTGMPNASTTAGNHRKT
jgi:XapX domain-containing protein